MKKNLLLLLLITFFSSEIKAQTIGTLTSTIGNYFVSGVSTVNNTITASDPSANWIDFYLADPTFSVKYDSLIDNTGGHTSKNWTYDMGLLDTGMVIWAIFYNNSGTEIGYNYYYPNIIVNPQWLLTNGNITNVNVTGNTVNMVGHFSFNNQPDIMPSDIPGLGNRPYSLVSPEMNFNIHYNCATGASIGNIPHVNFDLNIFNQTTFSYNYPIPSGVGISFDGNFNPHIVAEGTYNTPPFKLNWPLARIYCPIPIIKIDGGLEIEGELKGKLIYGYNTTHSSWGIDTARVTAKITATGTLRATADALIASASGTLIARGSIGGGFVYSDFSIPSLQPLFGMDLQIAGAIDYKIGRGIFTLTEGHLEKIFYDKTWGNQIRSPFEKQIWDNVDAFGNYTSLSLSNPYLKTPEFFAQPNMSANDSALYVVWLDYAGNNTNIKFNKLNYQTHSFSTPAIITSAEAISNPKVAILPSGNALISWTQNRFTSATFDTATMNLTDLFKAQDIWVTLYNKTSNSFYTPQMLSDVNTGPETGRAEGNANIIMGKGHYGLITWVVNNDNTNHNADVWYATVSESGGNVTLGIPQIMINLPGTNKAINVSYYDSTHAIASWISDPDGLDSTLNNKVVYREWTQTNATTGVWGAVYTLIANDGATSFDALSIDFNGIYGAIAWTSTNYDANGKFEKRITADAWNSSTQGWATPSMAVDTNYNFTQPKVSVNKNGYVALTYQDIKMFDDTLTPDVGRLNLYLNNSQTNPTSWVPNNGNPLLGDPAVYDWDLNTTYGEQNHFYIITQEADTTTGNAPLNPPNGTHFGNSYLNLVLRALDITPTVITDIPEPSTKSTYTNEVLFDYNLYPNPISSYTTIEYSINNQSNVIIEIYDLLGKKITTLYNGKQNIGTYKALFEPNGLTNGIYLCKVTINNRSVVKKMVITK